jgi:hypothetical protein
MIALVRISHTRWTLCRPSGALPTGCKVMISSVKQHCNKRFFAVIGIIFIASAFSDDRGKRIDEFNVAVDNWRNGVVNNWDSAGPWTYEATNSCGGTARGSLSKVSTTQQDDLGNEQGESDFTGYTPLLYADLSGADLGSSTSSNGGNCQLEFDIQQGGSSVRIPAGQSTWVQHSCMFALRNLFCGCTEFVQHRFAASTVVKGTSAFAVRITACSPPLGKAVCRWRPSQYQRCRKRGSPSLTSVSDQGALARRQAAASSRSSVTYSVLQMSQCCAVCMPNNCSSNAQAI